MTTARAVENREAYSYRTDPAITALDDAAPIIVFDGECIFCSGWVRFVLRHDKAGTYRFLTAQSPLGSALYRHYGLDERTYETNLLIENGRAAVKSRAALNVLARLGLPWSMVNILRVIPRPLADAAYDIVARNRYRIAGRRESCMMPTPEERNRFL